MIYIQSNKIKTEPHHFDCACALFGAIENSMEYRLTSFEEVSSGKFDNLIKNNLFVGSVEFMREVFNRIGLSNVRVPKNSNRESKIMILKEALKLKNVFIKPIEIKLFSGLILDGMISSCLTNIDENTEVLVYDVIENIVSEWRIYVSNNQIVDSRNYSGDFMLGPDYNYVKEVILNNKNFPCSYTIDIGILKNSENVVIEYNDMWAIGNYGVPNHIYLRLLKNRYFEIVRNFG
jgi:hypothetical protein